MKKVRIYGAGLAGLVAANLLADKGHEVIVYEKRASIGGPPNWHPSIHLAYFNTAATWDYIGMNLDQCFKKISDEKFYIYNRVRHVKPVMNYACERGPRESSIDSFLYQRAIEKNVQFQFNRELNINKLETRENVIVSCGLEKLIYEQLGIPIVPVQGFRACVSTDLDGFAANFFNKYTNYDSAYLGALNGILFILLFSRFKIANKELVQFQSFLSEKEHIYISSWDYYEGCVPLQTNLFKNGFILAGTISGLIDPFYLNGIPGALVSGKIAALAINDRNQAIIDFNRFTRNFYRKWALKKLYQLFPWKRVTHPVFTSVNDLLKGVGFV